jgi:hypothetical protein
LLLPFRHIRLTDGFRLDISFIYIVSSSTCAII